MAKKTTSKKKSTTKSKSKSARASRENARDVNQIAHSLISSIAAKTEGRK